MSEPEILDLLVVGAGPTGLAIGAEAERAGMSFLLVDRGALCESIRQYPTDMLFFTTRERLEIADVPFAIPDSKPSRAQALAYYREVARVYGLPIARHEEVLEVTPAEEGFAIRSRNRHGELRRRARAVALASGYFGHPRSLGVPGEDLPWVHLRYREPYGHFGDRVVMVGAGNSAIEAALELFRWGAEVTLVHRGERVKKGVKYWLQPDIANRIEEGSIRALFSTRVHRFEAGGVRVASPQGEELLEADAAYVLIGYRPELDLAIGAGVTVDEESWRPAVDPETCESDVPRFYVAGTLQAGRDTGRIFIENSRDHGPRIVAHLAGRLRHLRGTVRAAVDRSPR